MTDFERQPMRQSVSAAQVEDASVRLIVSRESLPSGVRLRVRATNDGTAPTSIEAITPALLHPDDGWFAEGLAGWAMWLQGRWMFADTFTHRFGRAETHPAFGGTFWRSTAQGKAYVSDGMTVLYHAESQRALLLGFISTARMFGEIVLTCDHHEQRLISIEARSLAEGWTLAPGETLDAESLVVLWGGDPLDVVQDYARMLGETMRARVPEHSPGGWNSWYYYYKHVTERDVLENLAALPGTGLPLDYVQIDDGYEPLQGDWLLPDPRFPSGMGAVARRISDAGFRPGLWLAPLVLHRDSRVLAERPEFAVRDANGEIYWQNHPGPWAVLDCTHPDARAWLTNVIRTMVQEWGYTFLKLDALGDACITGGRYHAENTTGAANLRLGLETVRAAAGDDIFLLGCSCPFGPAIGLVDAMRVGDDTQARWSAHTRPSVKLAERLAIARFWMHGALWRNDPDSLMTRNHETYLTEDEIRFHATCIALSGGLAGISDDLRVLPSERAAIAKRVMPALGTAARPLDLWQRETPALWVMHQRDGATLAFLNWEDAPIDLTIDLAALALTGMTHAHERWTGEPRDATGSTLTERAIPPHAARVVRLARGPLPPMGAHLLA